MKKRILALSLFAAISAAQAATVEPYGTVGVGFYYAHEAGNYVSPDPAARHPKSRWGMMSGADRASRLGLKGSENVGQGLDVGFQLESSLEVTTGNVGREEKGASRSFFDRQSRLYVKSDRFGEVGLGRFGSLSSSLGPYAVMGEIASPYFGDAANAAKTAFEGTISNTVAYQSPKLAGLQVTGMYSYEPYTFLEEGKQRYMGLALTYSLSKANLGVSFEKSRLENGRNPSKVMLAGNVDLDSFTVYGSMSYTRNDIMYNFNTRSYTANSTSGKQYDYQLGVKKPMSLGDFKAYAGYHLYTSEASKNQRGASLGGSYSYHLSKHTDASMGLDLGYGRYYQADQHNFTTIVNVGVTHSF